MSVSLALKFLYVLLGCNFEGIPANRDNPAPVGGGGGGGQKGKEFSEHHGESCYSQVKPQPNNVNKLSDIHKRSY